MIKDIIRGLLIPFHALKTIVTNRRLAALSLIPLLLSIFTWVVIWRWLFIPAQSSISQAITDFMLGLLGQEHISQVYGIVRGTVWVIVGFLMILLSAVTFAITTNLISLPINDFIAQASEKLIILNDKRKVSEEWRDILPLLLIDLKKSLISAICITVCVILAWVPIFNIFAAFTAWIFMSFQYVSYAQTRRFIGLREGFKQLFSIFPITIGFGFIITLGYSIPLLGIFVHPVALVGGTYLYREIVNKNLAQ